MAQPNYVFRSIHHPHGQGKSTVITSALATPIGICMLPVMIGALATMLEGYPVLSYLYFGFPIAVFVGSMWAWLRVRSVICEIHVRDESVAFRSVYEAAEEASALSWHIVLEESVSENEMRITLGLEEFSLNRADWDTWEELSARMHNAQQINQARKKIL